MPSQGAPPQTVAAAAGRGRTFWRAVVKRLPSADEFALGTMGAAVVLAPIHLAAIAIAVPMPSSGAGVRFSHHLFDLLHVAGFAALAGLVPAAVLGVTGSRGRRGMVGWLLLALFDTVAMYWLLHEQLSREANVVWGGRASAILFPLYVALCGLAIVAAHVLGGVLGRVARWRFVPLVCGVSAAITHHALLRDDYPGVHIAVEWVALVLMGGVLGHPLARRLLPRAADRVAPPATRWLAASVVQGGLERERPERAPGRRRWRVAVVAGTLAVLPWVITPSNAVRLELFQEPGAVGAHLLSQLAWTSPHPVGVPDGAASVYVPRVRAVDGSVPRPPRGRGPVVVLITVEAFRADVLASGAHDDVLPNLARLRAEGAYFPRAVAAGSQTSVSLTTLFTGRYFSQLTWSLHGQGAQRFLYPAEDPIVRFPELLTAAHVSTESFLGLAFLAGEFGLARGFQHERRIVVDRRHALARDVLAPLLARITRPGSGGLFAYAHLTEPHEPYDRGQVREGSDFERYVSEIAVVDGWLGQVMNALRTRCAGRGYLIVTGDHGEAFGEHGTRFHTKTLYEELVRVPLLVWGPGVQAVEHDELAGLIDIGPTVLELFGQAAPPWHMGQSLWPMLRGQRGPLRRPLFAEGRLRRAYFGPDGIKIIDDRARKTVEAYDLVADPDESNNLFGTEPARVAPHLGTLRRFFDRYERRMAGYHPPYKR